MPLTFSVVVVPDRLRADHAAAGGKDLAMHIATVPGGFLRVMSAREPVNGLKHHVTLSVGPLQGAAVRRATDEEVRETLSVWPHVEFEEDHATMSPGSLVRDFWEK